MNLAIWLAASFIAFPSIANSTDDKACHKALAESHYSDLIGEARKLPKGHRQAKISYLQFKSFAPIIKEILKLKEGLKSHKVIEELQILKKNNQLSPRTPYIAHHIKNSPLTVDSQGLSHSEVNKRIFEANNIFKWLLSEGEPLSKSLNYSSDYPWMSSQKEILKASMSQQSRDHFVNLVVDNTGLAAWSIRQKQKDLVKISETHKDFIWSEINNYLGHHDIFEYLITPIGEYGVPFSKAQIRTSQILMKLALELGRDKAKKVYQADPEFFDEWTTRGNSPVRNYFNPNASYKNTQKEAPIQSVLEGILSIHQALNLLVVKKLEGLNEVEAVEYLSENYINAITQRMPVGVVGPFSIAGYFFPKLLLKNSENKYKLNPEVLKNLNCTKKDQHQYIATTEPDQAFQGLGCPFSRIKEDSNEAHVVHELALIYSKIFKIVWNEM